MRNILTALVAGVGLLMGVHAHAEGVANTSPCDIKDKVPSGLFGFKGTDVTATIKAYDKLRPKDEYETSAAYKARHAKDVAGLVGGPQCIAVDPYQIGSKYDADHQRLTVDLLSWATGYGSTEGIRFVTDSKVTAQSSYVGSNAFGVSKDIKKTDKVEYGVYFDKRPYLAAMKAIGAKTESTVGLSSVIGFPVTPDKARALGKYNLKILLVYKWVPDYIVNDSDYHGATITEPYEDHTKSEFLKGQLLRVIVFDKSTGEVMFNKAVGA